MPRTTAKEKTRPAIVIDRLSRTRSIGLAVAGSSSSTGSPLVVVVKEVPLEWFVLKKRSLKRSCL